MDSHDAMVRAALASYQGLEVKTIGDGFLATFNATTRAVHAAIQIVNHAKGMGLDVRAEFTAETSRSAPTMSSDSQSPSRSAFCDNARSGQVLVSETVRGQLVGSTIEAHERGTHVLKGVPGEWRLFVATAAEAT